MMNMRWSRLALLAVPFALGCSGDLQEPSSSSLPTAGLVLEPGVTTAAWTPRTDVPFPRANSVAVTVRQGTTPRVYLFGGFVRNPADFEPEGIRRFDVYDPARDRWVRKSKMPFGVFATNGGEVIEGKIYIPGGFRDANQQVATMFEYDIRTDMWRTLPGARPGGYGASGVINDQLYVMTGWGTSRVIAHLDRYDPISGAWTNLPDAPHAHLAGGGAVLGGKFYVVGGISDGNFTANGDLDVFDPVTNSWATLAPMPNPRLLIAVAALNGKLYVFGGRQGGLSGGAVADVDVYDPGTDTWTAGVPMPVVREGPAVALIKPAPGTAGAYVMGGADLNFDPVVVTNQLFDPTATQ